MSFPRTLVRELWHNKTLVRIHLNQILKGVTLTGKTLDVGSGGDVHYLDFMPRTEEAAIDVIERKQGSSIDFEKDELPYGTNTYDTVMLLNVLEHVYHYRHLAGEVWRVLKEGGKIVGFTPFLVRYHPDPHDYFRYTDEALQKILEESGFLDIRIEPVSQGPFVAALNVFILSIPRILRIPCACAAYLLDMLFLALRPHAHSIYPMGYCFFARK